MGVRRRPTLPLPGGGSTIGAGGLSFRVRDGTGRFPTAVAAVTLWNLSNNWAHGWWGLFVVREPHSGRVQEVCCGEVFG